MNAKDLGPYARIWEMLTPRGRDILYWIMRGYRGSAAADLAGLTSRSTAHTEIKAIRREMVRFGIFKSEPTNEEITAHAVNWLIDQLANAEEWPIQ